MAQRVSKREQRAVEALRLERQGLTGLVQCEGCPETMLVPEDPGLCERHQPTHPDAWMAYQPNPFEGYDVIGNL